eukprot:2075963-Pyramimonas_sp.AAC.1
MLEEVSEHAASAQGPRQTFFPPWALGWNSWHSLIRSSLAAFSTSLVASAARVVATVFALDALPKGGSVP